MTHTIRNVEVFAVGPWNGGLLRTGEIEWDYFDLFSISQAARLLPEVPLTLGHGPRAPHVGVVRNIRYIDDKIVVDLTGIESTTLAEIESGAITGVSAELGFKRLRDDWCGTALLSVALLRADKTPAVQGLAPLAAALAATTQGALEADA